ncbi:MAG: PD40 domain-containing protein, partial [Candidatus Marinimicrobia bacterium]|nr:PD40 domain-containing protein [Candidatus Neomarinimicrobiota bacterium]
MFRLPLITLFTLSLLHGQGFWLANGRTHAELRWQVISTEHFNIIYHQGLDSVARRSAAIAEQVYQPIMDQLELDDFGTTDLVLTAEDEIANGFALPSNRIFIWALQNDAAGRQTGSRKWLSTVIAHEFQHVALFNGLKTWLGVWNFPWVPLWFVEGTAEYYTETWRVGRSDNQLKIHTYKNIMDRLDPHDAGYAKLLYMADKYGDSTITRIVHYRDPLKFGDRVLLNQPYRFGRAFQQVTGQSLDQFNEEWRRAMHTTYYSVRGQKEGVDEVGEPVILPRLAAIRGLSFSPDSSRVAVVGRADQGMGDWSLYVVSTDSTQRRVEVSYGYFGDRPAWSPDGKSLAVAQYHRGRNGSLLWDIRIIDVQDRRARWLTRNARAADPVWSLDGESILYVAHSGEAT